MKKIFYFEGIEWELKSLIEIMNYINNTFSNIKIKIFNEKSGFINYKTNQIENITLNNKRYIVKKYEDINFNKLLSFIRKYFKQYTGLDEIIIKEKDNKIIHIIFHENLIEIYKPQIKDNLEKILGVKSREYNI